MSNSNSTGVHCMDESGGR